MDTNDVIEMLKEKSATNPAVNAVCHMFAMRKRARHVVTVAALMQRMKKEGFDYDKNQYGDVLKLLAKLGFGKLDTDHRGQVRALKDVKTKLQSIGAAACGEIDKLESYRQRNKFHSLPTENVAAAVEPKPSADIKTLSITISVNGKPMNVSIPQNLTSEEIAIFIAKLK